MMTAGSTTAARATMLALTAFLFTGCDRAERGTTGTPAQRDAPGPLVIYAAGPRNLAEELAAAFTEQSGIPVALFSATSGQIMAKLEAEQYRPRADVVILASAPAADYLADKGRLRAPLMIGARGAADGAAAAPALRSIWDDPEGRWLASGAAAVGIAMRQEIYDPSLQWTDILEGSLAARATMPGPSRSGSAADFVLAWTAHDAERAWTSFLTARQSGMEIAAANSQAITNLLIGANDLIIGAVDYLIYREIARGEPLRMHFPSDGTAVVPRPIAMLASTPRPHAASMFIHFVRSDEGQQRIAARHLLPAFQHIERSAVRGPVDPVAFPPGPRLTTDQQRTILRRFQYDIERAVVVRQTAREPAR